MSVLIARLKENSHPSDGKSRLVRIVWVGYAVLLAAVTAPGLGLVFRALQTPCLGSNCIDGQITQTEVALLLSQNITLREYAILTFLPPIAILLVSLCLSALIVWLRPDEPYAVLVAFILTALGVSLTRGSLALTQVYPNLKFLNDLIWYIQGTGLVVGLCLFPDGTVAPRWSLWLVIGWAILHIPFSFLPSALWQQVFMFTFPPILVIAIGLQVYRYRKVYSPIQRQQSKWALLGFGLVIVLQVSMLPLALLFPSILESGTLAGQLSNLVIQIAILISLVMLTIAVLRYRLFDIDLLINRTLVYGAVAVLTIAVYFVVIIAINSVLRERSSTLAAFLAAGVVAFIFQPVRLQVQKAVNRIMYGRRDEPYAVLSRLGRQVEGSLQPISALPAIVSTIALTLQLPYAAVIQEQDGRQQIAVAWGVEQKRSLRIPLIYANQAIGELIVGERKPGEAFNMADQRLFKDLAPQVASAVHSLRLSTELERSRLEAVTTREQARRRLGGDLHDGVIQRMTGLLRKIEVIENHLDRDPVEIQTEVAEIKGNAHAIIDDIRHLTHSLHPPDLELLGLFVALHERVEQMNDASGSGLKVQFHTIGALNSLPAAVETAVYYITLEALANVQRHANASNCSVRLDLSPTNPAVYPTLYSQILDLEILDDGNRINTSVPSSAATAHSGGLGMISMHARAAEVGGLCEIETFPGRGTRVHVCVPLLQAD